MDEGKQPLTEAEQIELNKQTAVQQAEAQTGAIAVPRSMATTDPDPSQLDPRFDRDDLRQGKVAPAVKKHHLPRRIKIRRPRAKKGKPFKRSGEEGAEGATTDNEADDADLTEDEVEVPGEEEEEEIDAGQEGEKKKGPISKLFSKNSTA